MRKLILILFTVVTAQVFGQDPHFSQYYAAPLYLNPAFAGTSPDHRIIANHRIQWPALPKVFSTYAVSYDFFRPELKSGFGFLASTDRIGTAALRSTNFGFVYSYKIQMDQRWVLSPAVYFGYGNRGMNFNELVFGDQIEFNNQAAPTLDPIANQLDNQHYFDSGVGLLLYNKNSWIGGSWWHINQPDISFLDRTNRLPAKFTIHGGTRIQIYSGPWKKATISYFTPSFIYNLQGPFSQLDVGINYHVDPMMVGIWFRGIPIKQNVIGNFTRDALVFSTGLRFSRLQFQYSYDFTISELSVRSEGAHEISMEYRVPQIVNHRRVPKVNRILPCPAYVPYESYDSNQAHIDKKKRRR